MADERVTSPALTIKDQEQVKKMVDERFFQYGEKRLGNLKPRVLDELVRICSSPKDPEVCTKEDKVKRILEAKKELQKEASRETETRCETPAPPPATDEPVPTIPEEPPPPPAMVDRPSPGVAKLVRPVFKKQHELNIVAFNSLKLRLDHPDVGDDWDAAILEFSKYDVLMMSEVRASDTLYKKRALKLLEMLNARTEEDWTMEASDPSGPGAKEVHLVIAKAPVLIGSCTTLDKLGTVSMEHAPFVASLEDPRFVGDLRRINVVSVHMPPNPTAGRRAARDAQIRKLTETYARESTPRLDAPFTNQGAKDTRKEHPYVAHIIGGDFNASASELRELDVEKHGWEVVLGNVRTSSGGKSYDNWLINRECKDHLVVGVDVLDLTQYANFSRGQQGLSDHAPIALRIKEMPALAPPPPPRNVRKTRSQSVSENPLW